MIDVLVNNSGSQKAIISLSGAVSSLMEGPTELLCTFAYISM